MLHKRATRRDGFSLLELVIVVVIIGIIAAIAIPRMSRGSAGASDSALSGNLAVLRNAIDLYAAEHNGTYPTEAAINEQITQYTDSIGGAQATKDGTHIYGPYVRKVPPLPVGARKGNSVIANLDGATVGWIYTGTPGTIRANTTDAEVDASGTKYNEY